MKFSFTPITIANAKLIDTWEYPKEYGVLEDLYMTPYFTPYNESGKLIGPGGCEGFVASLDGKVAGLFEFTFEEDVMIIGLALEPSFVGKGLGADFVLQGIDFGLKHYNVTPPYIKLEVEKSHLPSIRVYENAGFVKVSETEDEIEMRKSI